jgi:DMSO/TMAO reductase YedYZ molybdopterin-dependent catalytic subunit
MIPYKLQPSGDPPAEAAASPSLARTALFRALSRRSALRQIGIAGLSLLTAPALADEIVKLPLPSDPRDRPTTHDFPQKGGMILQRTRPPLLETPMEVFDRGVFTPNDQFYVRWHWAVIPNSVDVNSFRLAVRGHVNQILSLSIDDLLKIAGGACRRQSMLGQLARILPAARRGRAMGARRHG